MRTARPVGLSEDGRSLIVETGDGERIAILADAQLRRALHGDPPRRLEIEVESRLTPREIQMKVRAGASAEEIADASGMPIERVEAFAAPVVAERNHIAGLAQQGSVRRRGEPTGQRTLRLAVAERLRERGVDPDTVRWDAFKLDDGRWSVSADYRLEQADREAVFYFDQRGRFSVAGNDEARWVVGEQPEPGTTVVDAGAASVEPDTEPTLKLAGPAEELALLRALETGAEDEDDEVESEADGLDDLGPGAFGAAGADDSGEDYPSVRLTEVEVTEVTMEVSQAPTGAETGSSEPVPDEPSQLEVLYDLLGGEGYAEDSIRVYDGLTDAAAVPDLSDGDWQPAAGPQEVPAEPEPEDDGADVDESLSHAGQDAAAEPQVAQAVPASPVDETPDTGAEHPAGPTTQDTDEPQADNTDEPQADNTDEPQAGAEQELPVSAEPAQQPPTGPEQVDPTPAAAPATQVLADGATQEVLPGAEQPAGPGSEPGQGTPEPAAKPKKRKRAAVPSWDEIMFGSPKSK